MAETHEGVASAVTGAVLVDVGQGAGALVVHTRAQMLGARVDLVDATGTGSHVDVLERRGAGGSVAAAVFGSIAAGSYRVELHGAHGSHSVADVRIRDGVVEELDLIDRSS
jgi:hypothetical protein